MSFAQHRLQTLPFSFDIVSLINGLTGPDSFSLCINNKHFKRKLIKLGQTDKLCNSRNREIFARAQKKKKLHDSAAWKNYKVYLCRPFKIKYTSFEMFI